MEPKQQVPYPLRMPAELRERLEKAAKESNRSMNSEVVARLEGSLQGMNPKDAEALAEQIWAMSERIQQYEEAYGLAMVTQGFLAQAVIDAYSKNGDDLTPAQRRVVALAEAAVERQSDPRKFAESFLGLFGEIQADRKAKPTSKARPKAQQNKAVAADSVAAKDASAARKKKMAEVRDSLAKSALEAFAKLGAQS